VPVPELPVAFAVAVPPVPATPEKSVNFNPPPLPPNALAVIDAGLLPVAIPVLVAVALPPLAPGASHVIPALPPFAVLIALTAPFPLNVVLVAIAFPPAPAVADVPSFPIPLFPGSPAFPPLPPFAEELEAALPDTIEVAATAAA
jgi:hypothetical protein